MSGMTQPDPPANEKSTASVQVTGKAESGPTPPFGVFDSSGRLRLYPYSGASLPGAAMTAPELPVVCYIADDGSLAMQPAPEQGEEIEALKIYDRIERELAVEEARADRLLRLYNV